MPITLIEPLLGVYESKVVVTSTGPITYVDPSASSFFDVTLTSDTEIVFTGSLLSDQVGSVTVLLRQDATGSRLVTYRSSVRFPGGIEPVLTTTPNRGDLLVFSSLDGGNAWLAKLAQADMRLGFVTPAIVQQTSEILTSPAETLEVTLGAAPTLGNLLVAVGQVTASGVSALTVDNFENAVRRTGGSSLLGVGIWWRVAGASEPSAVTLRLPSGNTKLLQLAVLEVSGVVASPLDQVASAESFGALATSQVCGTTEALVQSTEFAVAALGASSDATFSNTWTNGFVRRTNNTRLTTASKVTTSKAAVSTTESLAVGRVVAGVTATFRAAAA